MTQDDDIPGLDETQARIAELETMTGSLRAQITHTLIMWVIRWIIGFGIIYVITRWTGRYDWLWNVGIIIAGLSLIFTIATKILTQHMDNRIRATAVKIEHALRDSADDN